MENFTKLLKQITPKTYLAINFGCRVNSAEINQLSQLLIDHGFKPFPSLSREGSRVGLILVNTCAVTQKGEYESQARIRVLSQQYPHTVILATGCANLESFANQKNIFIFNNLTKEKILSELNCAYTSNIKDKFTNSQKYLLKVQSGCTLNCTYCIVPQTRSYLWSLPIETAISTVNQAYQDGYRHLIITGVNLIQYQYGFSNLLESLLTQTQIPLISFGSLPLNCVDDKFIEILKNYKSRIKNFLHIPIQSGSDRILKLMHRPYDQKTILKKFKNLKLKIKNLEYGTDIIVGFPSESDKDFQQTLDLCRQIGFKKIHTFKFSPRHNTKAYDLYQNQKTPLHILKKRSLLIRSLTYQTTLPSRQTPEN